MTHVRQFAFKKVGYVDFHNPSNQRDPLDIKDFIKIVFIKAGGHVIIDFEEYYLKQDAFFSLMPDNTIGSMIAALEQSYFITGTFIVLKFMIRKWLVMESCFIMFTKFRLC